MVDYDEPGWKCPCGHRNHEYHDRYFETLGRVARQYVIVGQAIPRTEAGRSLHMEWHGGALDAMAPPTCGTAGCGFLGRILAIEEEARG